MSEKLDDPEYVPPSPEALAKLDAGIESAKTQPLVARESFAKYADDGEQLTAEERYRLELLAGDRREAFNDDVAKLLRIHDAQAPLVAAARECERRYSLHTPWPAAEELRLALIKDCPHTERFNFAGGEWQCERCGATGPKP